MEDVDIFEMAKLIAKFSLDKKAEEVKILDLRPLTTVTDFFVICSADSEPQVKAIADNIERKMLDEGFKVYHTEGYSNLNWVLLDYFDVVVHIFLKPKREFFSLERLWHDAKITEITDKDFEN